ncbi:Exported acylaminoacyl-peptidase (fragment) [Xanthomonas citri pv. citri]
MQQTRQTHALTALSRATRHGLAVLVLGALLAGPAPAAERPSADTAAEQASRIALWPTPLAPGDTALPQPQRIVERSSEPTQPDRYIQQVSSRP